MARTPFRPTFTPNNYAEIHGCFIFQQFALLHSWVVFPWMDLPQFLSPFFCGWTLGLFPLLGSYEQSYCQQLIQISEWTYAFICLHKNAMEKLPTVFQSILAMQKISKYPAVVCGNSFPLSSALWWTELTSLSFVPFRSLPTAPHKPLWSKRHNAPGK